MLARPSVQAIELKKIGFRYGRVWVLKELDLCVAAGETFAILGPNASGKSTLLKILATRLKPTKGEGKILGHDLLSGVSKIRENVEWLGHELALYKTLTAKENLRFHLKLKGKKPDEGKIEAALEKAGLGGNQTKAVGSFSKGQVKRLALARILLEDPKIILLDEPHANLDQEGKQLLNQLITQWKKGGTTLLLASHDHEEILPLCDKTVTL